jgi:hypothetical protein
MRGRRLRSRNSTIVSAIVTVISSADTASSQPAFPRPLLDHFTLPDLPCGEGAAQQRSMRAPTIMCSCNTMVTTTGSPAELTQALAVPREPASLAHSGGARGAAPTGLRRARATCWRCAAARTRAGCPGPGTGRTTRCAARCPIPGRPPGAGAPARRASAPPVARSQQSPDRIEAILWSAKRTRARTQGARP